MNWPSKTLCFSLILGTSLFLACGGQVIKRNAQGDNAHTPKKRADYIYVKKKMALLDFFNESPFGGEDLAVVGTEEMRTELTRTGQFIIDPEGNKIFGSSKEIYSGGGAKLVQLAKKAKLSGINFVVYGRIIDARVREKSDEIGLIRKTNSYSETLAEIRIFDVNSNKEIFTRKVDGNADDSTFRFYSAEKENRLQYRQEMLRYSARVAIRRSIAQIMEFAAKLDWIGRVARILGGKVYINAGRNSGINVGDVLKVMTEGEEVFDPETGALIGKSKGDVKGTLEIVDYFGPDGTIAILHSGGSVLEGDFVQLY